MTQAVKDMVRHPFCFPGGYAKTLYMQDGETMCHACTKENVKLILRATRSDLRDGWAAAGVDVYWEGPPIHCANCNGVINSEYGDPEVDDDEAA